MKEAIIYSGEGKAGEQLNDCLQDVEGVVMRKLVASCSLSPPIWTEAGQAGQARAKERVGKQLKWQNFINQEQTQRAREGGASLKEGARKVHINTSP